MFNLIPEWIAINRARKAVEWKVVAWKDTDGLLDWVEFEYTDGAVVRLILEDGDSKRRWPAWKVAEWLQDDDIGYAEQQGMVEGSATLLPLEDEDEKLDNDARFLSGVEHKRLGAGSPLPPPS